MVSGSEDGTVRIWNAVTGQIERVLGEHPGGVDSVAISRDGTPVVYGLWTGLNQVCNAATGEIELVLEGHPSVVVCCILSRWNTCHVRFARQNSPCLECGDQRDKACIRGHLLHSQMTEHA